MPKASSNAGQLSYIKEVTPGTTPATGNGANLRVTQPTMKAAIATSKSSEISANRMASTSTNTDLNVDGGFDFELSAKEFDPFIQGVVGNSFTHYGTNGLGTTFSATIAAGTITAGAAPTGGSAFTNLTAGSWFKIVPPAGAAQAAKDYLADAWFKVGSTTSTTITLDASTPVASVGQITTTAGYAISQSTVVNGNAVSAFTFEWNQADIGQILTYRGMQTNTLSLSLDVGSIIKGSFGFIGLGHDIVTSTTLPGTTAASNFLDVMNSVTDVGVIYENGLNILSGGSFIKSAKLDISNNLRAQKAIATYGSAGIGIGELAISGTLEVYFQDATYYKKWLNGTTTSLALGMCDAAGNGYMVEMDKVRFKDGGLNGLAKDQDVMLSLPFDALYSSATGRGIRITRGIAA